MPPPVPSPDDEGGIRRSPRPTAALEERIEETMDRVQQDGHNHVERIAALEEYLTLVHSAGRPVRGGESRRAG